MFIPLQPNSHESRLTVIVDKSGGMAILVELVWRGFRAPRLLPPVLDEETRQQDFAPLKRPGPGPTTYGTLEYRHFASSLAPFSPGSPAV